MKRVVCLLILTATTTIETTSILVEGAWWCATDPTTRANRALKQQLFRAGNTAQLRLGSVRNGFYSKGDEDGDSKPKSRSTLTSVGSSTTTTVSSVSIKTALAVIPPDDAWDSIQRARYRAGDKMFRTWPPAIRLFHPFCAPSATHDVALQIAECIEKHQIQPFTVKLNQWSVVPHQEALQVGQDRAQGHAFASSTLHSPAVSDLFGTTEEIEAVEQLIQQEERLGKQRRKKALKKQQQKVADKEAFPPPQDPSSSSIPHSSSSSSPHYVFEQQRRMYEQFNGPCIVCLEPDPESQQRLRQIRQLLHDELFEAYGAFSIGSASALPYEYESNAHSYYHHNNQQLHNGNPSSSSSSFSVADNEDDNDEISQAFRPVVPIATFSTVSAALEMARRLRGLWTPVSFNVTDFHILATLDDEDNEDDDDFDSDVGYPRGLQDEVMATPRDVVVAESTSSAWESNFLNTAGQYGCDAMIMLMGQEVPMDAELNQEIAQFILEQGQAGGADAPLEESKAGASGVDSNEGDDEKMEIDDDDDDDGLENLLAWLDEEDEDYEEGTSVVIGRTHFFTGDMRFYVGMPATSFTDGKDRAMADGETSATARRRGAVHRAGNIYQDGDWGQKAADVSPWSKQQSKARQRQKPPSQPLVE